MKKNMVAVGVIILLVCLAVTPDINSQLVNIEKRTKFVDDKHESETIEIVVREYHGDGTYTEITKEIPVEVAQELKKKLWNSDDVEDKIAFLKKHGIVPKDTSLEKYRNKAQRLVEKMDLPNEKAQLLRNKINSIKFSNDNISMVFNICSGIFLIVQPFALPIGLSLVTGILNYVIWWMWTHDLIRRIFLPSADLPTGFIGKGLLETKGVLGYQNISGGYSYELVPLAGFLLGFVGSALFCPIPPIGWVFVGATPMVFALGLA